MIQARDWLTRIEPGFEALRLPQVIRSENFLSSDPSENRILLEYYWHPTQKIIRAKAYFGPRAQGPPDHAHGGSMAAVLDEAMGAVAWRSGHPVLAAELVTRFKRPLPLNSEVWVQTEVQAVEGRKVRTSGTLTSRDEQTLYAEAEALFVKIDPARFGIQGDHFFG